MIRLLSRPRGRHHAGQPHTTAHRRVWDGPARAEAEHLERSQPGWVVLYSLGERRFYALATWPAPEPVIVRDDTAEGLEEQMRERETACIWWALSVPSAPGGYGDALPPPAASSPARAATPAYPHWATPTRPYWRAA